MPRSRLVFLPALLFALLATAASPAHARRSADFIGLHFDQGGYARIPFDLRGQHIWIRGIIGKSDSLWIVVDTGASSSVMDDSLASRLGFEVVEQHEAHGAGGSQPGATVADVTIGVPGLSITRHRLDTTALAALSAMGGRPMNLILGHELFAACVVRFDYPGGIMEVWDAEHPPASLPGVVLPMTFEENLPYVEGTLSLPGRAPLEGRFVIDTGSGGGVMLASDVVERDSIARAFPRTLETVARGVGGERHLVTGRADSFALGDLRFNRPLVNMEQAGPGRITAPGAVGNIGGQLLGRCRVTFDYPHHRVGFEAGPEFRKPFEAEMSGATISRDATGWSVRLVNPDTPASEAGLREGDVLTQVDDQPAATLDPAALRKLMQTEGRAVRLGVRRGDRDETVTLVLRRIL